jgi:pimeloyl-ACP methyl ester carboxylesterase
MPLCRKGRVMPKPSAKFTLPHRRVAIGNNLGSTFQNLLIPFLVYMYSHILMSSDSSELLKIHYFAPFKDAVPKDQKRTGIILLHGLGGSVRIWKKLSVFLIEHGYHVLALDILGFNESPDINEDVTMSDHVDYLVRTATYCSNYYQLDHLYAIGNSFGGQILVAANHDHPDLFRKVIAVNAPLIDSTKMLEKMKSSLLGKLYYLRGPIRRFLPRLEKNQRLLGAAKRLAHLILEDFYQEHIEMVFETGRFENYFLNAERVILNNDAHYCLNHDNICLIFSRQDTYVSEEEIEAITDNNPKVTVIRINSLEHNPFIDPVYQQDICQDIFDLLLVES